VLSQWARMQFINLLEALPLCFKKNTSVVLHRLRPKLQWAPLGLLPQTERPKDRQRDIATGLHIASFAYIGGRKQKKSVGPTRVAYRTRRHTRKRDYLRGSRSCDRRRQLNTSLFITVTAAASQPAADVDVASFSSPIHRHRPPINRYSKRKKLLQRFKTIFRSPISANYRRGEASPVTAISTKFVCSK